MIETAKNLLSAIGLGTLLIVSAACTGSSDTSPSPASTPTPAQAADLAPTAAPVQATVPAAPAAQWAADGVITPGEYADSRTYGKYEIHWTNDAEHIYVAMRAETEGWVAVAFGADKRMNGADMIFGYVAEGAAAVSDEFSTGEFGPHQPDGELGGTADILIHGGVETDGFTTVEFKRALDTGDSRDAVLAPGANAILWAYGLGDSPARNHSGKGYGDIELR